MAWQLTAVMPAVTLLLNVVLSMLTSVPQSSASLIQDGAEDDSHAPLSLVRSVTVRSDPVDVKIDTSAGLLVVISRSDDSVTIVPLDESQKATSLNVSPHPSNVAVLEQRREAWVLSDRSSEISIIDLDRRQFAGTISLGRWVVGDSDRVPRLVVTPDERVAYVLGEGRHQTTIGTELPIANLITVDVEQRSVRSVDSLDGTITGSIDAVPFGAWLEESHALLVWTFGQRGSGGVVARGLLRDEAVLAGVGQPGARCVALDMPRNHMYVGDLDWVIVGDLAITGRSVSMGLGTHAPYPLPLHVTRYYSRGAPCTMVVDQTMRRLYVANAGRAAIGVIDLDSNQFTWAMQLESAPWGIALDSTRHLLAVAMRDRATVDMYQIASP